MNLRHAKKLHNEDEVIDKKTGESVRVLSVAIHSPAAPMSDYAVITGVGDRQGYKEWFHKEVR